LSEWQPDQEYLRDVAHRCARIVRGCATDEQYKELVDQIAEALAFEVNCVIEVGRSRNQCLAGVNGG
jgi:hypothetical protein